MKATRWALAALLAVLSGCGPKAEPEPLYIGHLLPLSGPDRARGEEARQGVRLAVEEALTADVRCAGRPLAVRHVDDRGDAETVRAEATRLLAVNRVPALLGGVDPALNQALARTVQPSGVPVLLPTELPEPPRADNIFCLEVSPAERGRALAGFAHEDLKATRAAVVVREGDPVAGTLAAAFVEEWKRDRRREVRQLSLKKEGDPAEALLEVSGSKADVVLLAVPPDDFVPLRRRLPADRLLLYGGADAGPASLAGEKDGAAVYLATVFCHDALTEQGREFAARYEKEFQGPPDLVAAQAYDGVRLLFEALARAGPTPAKLREYLGGLEDWATVTGPLSLKDHRTRRPLFVVRRQGSEEKLMKTIPPEKGK